MGKYIVELEDGEHLYKTTINALGNPVMRSAEKVPYTEPDLERVKKTAYDDGYSAGCQAGREDLNRVMSDVKQIKKEAYEYTKYLNKSYEDGLNDAWEAARKIVLGSINFIVSVFGSGTRSNIIKDLTAAQAIEKLQAYEQEQEEKKKTDYYFEMMKDAIETSAKEYGMSLDEVAAVLDKMRACGSPHGERS